jgi:hypothetical protein
MSNTHFSTDPRAAVKPRRTNPIQILAWVYAALFLAVVLIAYVPGVNDAQGNLFGLFSLQLHDHALHLVSAVWAALAAWISYGASVFYFRVFGTLYALDGVMGLLFGQGYLDGGIVFNGITPLPWSVKIATNLPHLVLGFAAMYIGFVLSRKYAEQ